MFWHLAWLFTLGLVIFVVWQKMFVNFFFPQPLLSKSTLLWGWVFQALPIYMGYLCQTMNITWKSKKITSNDKKQDVKLHSWNEINTPKICATFLNFGKIFNHLIFLPQWTLKVVQSKRHGKISTIRYPGCSTANILDRGIIWSHQNTVFLFSLRDHP